MHIRRATSNAAASSAHPSRLALMQARHAETVEKQRLSLRLRPSVHTQRCLSSATVFRKPTAPPIPTVDLLTFWPAPAITCTSPLPCIVSPVDVAPAANHSCTYPIHLYCCIYYSNAWLPERSTALNEPNDRLNETRRDETRPSYGHDCEAERGYGADSTRKLSPRGGADTDSPPPPPRALAQPSQFIE